MNSSFVRILNTLVVYKVSFTRCNPIYVGQNSRQVTTRIPEHRKKYSHVGQGLVQYCGTALNIEWDIVDACWGLEKTNELMLSTFDLCNSETSWYIIILNFVNPNNWRIIKDRAENNKSFLGNENKNIRGLQKFRSKANILLGFLNVKKLMEIKF